MQKLQVAECSGDSSGRIIERPAIMFNRLLDQTFYGKTVDQMIRLLGVLGQEVDLVLRRAA
ncbi:MAG TPA: hypothetical protein PLP17_02690 [Oligoflexia bacterium]|nr:hypothetical protein [Oligoflexia bacterium]